MDLYVTRFVREWRGDQRIEVSGPGRSTGTQDPLVARAVSQRFGLPAFLRLTARANFLVAIVAD